jgi:formylglycine-generating enzyme required for sulfatase activity
MYRLLAPHKDKAAHGDKEIYRQAPGTPTGSLEYVTTRMGSIKLKRIPAGSFLMGSHGTDRETESGEKPQHSVRISKPFYLGIYEVTQGQYQEVMGWNPSKWSSEGEGKDAVTGQDTDRHPVESVTWFEAVRFCNLLSEREGLRPFYVMQGGDVRVPDWDGTGYRLPTEAEWEYACRAGSRTRYSFGDDANGLSDHAWFVGNSGMAPNPVGQKRPNPWGLHDMHGNMSEWCWDWYDREYYKNSTDVDPRGAEKGDERVIRGGGHRSPPFELRSAFRHRSEPWNRRWNAGFRIARTEPLLKDGMIEPPR